MDTSKLLTLVRKIAREQENLVPFRVDGHVLKEGLDISKRAMSMAEDISLTPYSKNALLKLDGKEYLHVGDETTKMEIYYERETLKLLKKYCPTEFKSSYDDKLPPWDIRHYYTDCWRNFKKGSDVRHVHKNMNLERAKNFAKFYKPLTPLDIDKLRSSNPKLFDEVINLLDVSMPSVKSSSSWEELSLPFMNKHTNVGYPYFRNDKTRDSKTGQTYAELTNNIAKRMSPKEVVSYPYVAFGRNLRGKARPILGGSRIQALVYNQLESQEIKAYKENSPLFIGYNNDEIIREKMIKLGKFLKTRDDLTCWNRDYAAFDTTVNPGLRRLIDALSVMKSTDSRLQDIAFYRGVSHYKSQLINGLTGKLEPIYCRILSGEIDTNRGGGLVNAFADLYAITTLYPSFPSLYNELASIGTSGLWVMGDDNLLVQPKQLDNNKYSSIIKNKFGLEVSHEKGEFGLFYLQRRVFEADGRWVFITPFTRVIRSMISKENRKGLGPAGWTIASYMLLDQLKEWPDLLIDVARIFARFDEYKLGTVWSVKQLTQMVADEDKRAISEDKRAVTTASKLYDGDPLKQKWFKSDGSVDDSYLGKIHNILLQGLQRDLK